VVFGVAGEKWLRTCARFRSFIRAGQRGIAQLAGSFDDAAPGDPADRIIAATAIALESKLVTATGGCAARRG